jgi:murein DD-endopeptidase
MLVFLHKSLIILFLLIGSFGANADPQLGFPLACTLAKDCWVMNYMDVDPNTDSASDFKCRTRTYDKHKGTDFAVRDWSTMQQGVDVLAAAEGTVLRLRDGIEDKILSSQQLQNVLKANKGCGNGVFIDHGEGWQTNYCHMKKGSITVGIGETISVGQKIGEVGHSGNTEFPHLHIGVSYKNQVIDPFTGLSNNSGCTSKGKPLWHEDLQISYDPVSIHASGFKDGVPEFAAIKKDASSPTSLSLDAPALTFWISLLGVARDDRIQMQIRDPLGRIFAEREITQPKDRAWQFYFVGKRTRSQKLISGTYIGSISLSRQLANGETLVREISRELIVE